MLSHYKHQRFAVRQVFDVAEVFPCGGIVIQKPCHPGSRRSLFLRKQGPGQVPSRGLPGIDDTARCRSEGDAGIGRRNWVVPILKTEYS